MPWWSNKHVLNKTSRDGMVPSDWPCIWWWYAELILNWVPNVIYSDCQNLDVNLRSRSDTMLVGTLYNLTTFLTYNFANLSMDVFWLISRKCTHLVNLSIITQIESLPFVDLGTWVTKFMKMLSHFHWGISSVTSMPLAFGVQSSLFGTPTSIFILVHQKDSFRSLYILVIPGCMLRRLLCPSSKIFFINSLFLGAHTLFI